MLGLVLCAALVLADLASPALAEPVTEEAIELIDGKLNDVLVMSNPYAARDRCREAEAIAATYDREPYFDGAIAECFAYALKHLKEKDAACQQRTRTLERLEAVPVDHPRHAQAAEMIDGLGKDQSWFGC